MKRTYLFALHVSKSNQLKLQTMKIKKLEFTTVDNFVKIYSQNQELALDFKKFVIESEDWWLQDILEILKQNAALEHWNYGIYEDCHIYVRNSYEFMKNVEQLCKEWGMSGKIENSAKTLRKLFRKNSNLCDYFAQGLANQICKGYFQYQANFLENAFYFAEKSDDFRDLCDRWGEDFLACREYYTDGNNNLVRVVNLTA